MGDVHQVKFEPVMKLLVGFHRHHFEQHVLAKLVDKIIARGRDLCAGNCRWSWGKKRVESWSRQYSHGAKNKPITIHTFGILSLSTWSTFRVHFAAIFLAVPRLRVRIFRTELDTRTQRWVDDSRGGGRGVWNINVGERANVCFKVKETKCPAV